MLQELVQGNRFTYLPLLEELQSYKNEAPYLHLAWKAAEKVLTEI